MSSPDKVKAIVLTCDRYRAITEHMIFQYDRLCRIIHSSSMFPIRPWAALILSALNISRCPQTLKSPSLHLLAEIDDDEWIYWCVDDKYPIELRTHKIASLISHAMRTPEVDGLLFCRCRATLKNPKLTLCPGKIRNPFGDV